MFEPFQQGLLLWHRWGLILLAFVWLIWLCFSQVKHKFAGTKQWFDLASQGTLSKAPCGTFYGLQPNMADTSWIEGAVTSTAFHSTTNRHESCHNTTNMKWTWSEHEVNMNWTSLNVEFPAKSQWVTLSGCQVCHRDVEMIPTSWMVFFWPVW